MLLLTNCCLFVLLVAVVLQDIKYRQISWFLIPLLICFFLMQGVAVVPIEELVYNTLINLGFIAIQLLLLTVYMSMKNKKLVNIIDLYLGLGDVLFFVVIATALSPINFILFFVVGLLFTLIAYLIYQLMVKRVKEIPLAGAMAVLMIGLLLLNQWMPAFNLHDDVFVTNWLLN